MGTSIKTDASIQDPNISIKGLGDNGMTGTTPYGSGRTSKQKYAGCVTDFS
jgi:hypothetical protein